MTDTASRAPGDRGASPVATAAPDTHEIVVGRDPVHRPFGRRLVDALTDRVGTPLHHISPFFGHAYDDGATVRTLLGDAYLALPVAGGVLGAMAVSSSHGLAVPPALWLMLTITVLGILDAFTGFVATVVFAIGVLVTGHLISSHWVTGPPGTQGTLYAFTGLLAMAFFWFIAPQLPRRIRLLGFRTIRSRLHRRYVMVGDFIVVPLLMILILGSMPVFIPLFTGATKQSLTQVVIQNDLVTVKVVVGIAAVIRVALDEVVHARFRALDRTRGHTRHPVTRFLLRVAGAAVVLALTWEVIGTIWQWPVVWALIMSSDWLSAAGERLLRPSAIYRYVPRYLFRIVTLLLFDEYAARELTGRIVSGAELLGWLVLLLVVVISIYAVLDGADDLMEEERRPTWRTRVVGMAVVVALFILAENLWGIAATPYANPTAVATSPSGQLFIADSGNNRVIQVGANGDRAAIGSGLDNPEGVAWDPTSQRPSVYIANTNANEVERAQIAPAADLIAESSFAAGHALYSASAATVTTVGSGLLRPTGVATNATGTVFIADTGHNRVVEVLATGQQLVLADQLSSPTAVATDPFGYVYVADTGAGTVLRYSVGTNGANLGTAVIASGLSSPEGVAADAQGNVFVSDTGANKVFEYLADGRRLTVPGSFDRPAGLAVDAAGHLYIADQGHGLVVLSEPQFTPIADADGPTGPATSATIGPSGVTAVDVSSGSMYQVGPTSSGVLTTGLPTPSGVAWSLGGQLYVSLSTPGLVVRVDPATGDQAVITRGLPGVRSLIPAPDGGLYALWPGKGEIVHISTSGVVKVVLHGLHDPTSLVRDAYGYFDVTLGDVGKDGGELWQIHNDGKAVILLEHLSDPGSLSADGNGDVFFVEYGTHQVWESRGLLGAQIVYTPSSAATDPSSVAATSNGDVYVFTMRGHTVIRLESTSVNVDI